MCELCGCVCVSFVSVCAVLAVHLHVCMSFFDISVTFK